MTVDKVDATLADFAAHFDRLFATPVAASDGKVKLLLFLADREPGSSSTWCAGKRNPFSRSLAYCNVAEPVIYERLEGVLQGRDAVLLRAYVGDKPTWRDPAHPWRVDPRFELKGVPTLIRWENGAAAARLGDEEAHLKDKVDALLGAGGN
ncbi:Thioredoxin-like protein Clot [Dichanthelium oligosanthes]|uniref:Thioredoxin-like protein Clot n=1 Tax=Dichanthelium oligosanthes TaxID=888268 RepID=A0A1E5W6D7_9POAL|nr:Thioredoxin-like protein Clot [Dichanthelium oligosanthes]